MGQVEDGLCGCSVCALWAGRNGHTKRNDSLRDSCFSQSWIQLKWPEPELTLIQGIMEFHESFGCALCGVRDCSVWRAGETTEINDTSGLGAQPWVFLPFGTWCSSHQDRQTQGLKVPLSTRDGTRPRGSSSCTHRQTWTLLDQSGSSLLVTVSYSLDITTSF